MRQGTRKVRPAAIGMMHGVWIGGALGVLAFTVTQNPVWFALTGVGVAFGLGIGAAVERREDDSPRGGGSGR